MHNQFNLKIQPSVGFAIIAALLMISAAGWWLGAGWLAWTSWGIALAGSGAFALIARHAAMQSKTLADQCSGNVRSILDAAGQMTISGERLTERLGRQSNYLQESSGLRQKMTATAQNSVNHSREAMRLMTAAGVQVADANRSLDGMMQSMGAIGGASEKIARIIKIIDEIAFQTNILALNAAVEAARAGEAGVGFAVVADEVRNLATRCAQAAKDTNDLIAESIDATRTGKARLDHMAEAIRGITESSTGVKRLVDDVTASSSDQARNVQEIAQSLDEVERIAQQTTSGAEQNAASIVTVTKQAEAMAITFKELAQALQR